MLVPRVSALERVYARTREPLRFIIIYTNEYNQWHRIFISILLLWCDVSIFVNRYTRTYYQRSSNKYLVPYVVYTFPLLTLSWLIFRYEEKQSILDRVSYDSSLKLQTTKALKEWKTNPSNWPRVKGKERFSPQRKLIWYYLVSQLFLHSICHNSERAQNLQPLFYFPFKVCFFRVIFVICVPSKSLIVFSSQKPFYGQPNYSSWSLSILSAYFEQSNYRVPGCKQKQGSGWQGPFEHFVTLP